eukprot:11965421-Ditylum_brightwellii.AAC.1
MHDFFAFVVLELAAVVFIDELPVGNICGRDNHVSAEGNLCRCGTQCCMIGGAEGKGCALQHSIYVIGSRWGSTAVQVIGTEVLSDDKVDVLADGICSGVYDGGEPSSDAIGSEELKINLHDVPGLSLVGIRSRDLAIFLCDALALLAGTQGNKMSNKRQKVKRK